MKNFAFILALFLFGCSSSKNFVRHGIPNFHAIDAGQAIYRGGQPDDRGGAYLSALGVSNIVKLNLGPRGLASGWTRDMRGAFIYKPIDFWHQTFLEPDPETIGLAVANIVPGTFIHCSHGRDRTGLVVACYRHWVQKWTKQAAQREMLAQGFHPSLKGLWDFWQNNSSDPSP
jgi:protein tyrosine/serine phosphatase